MANQQQPMLSFPYKVTKEVRFSCLILLDFPRLKAVHVPQVDLVSAIRDHAASAYNQSNDPDAHPDALAPDAKKLQDLRKDATILVGTPPDLAQASMLSKMLL